MLKNIGCLKNNNDNIDTIIHLKKYIKTNYEDFILKDPFIQIIDDVEIVDRNRCFFELVFFLIVSDFVYVGQFIYVMMWFSRAIQLPSGASSRNTVIKDIVPCIDNR